MTDCYFEEAVLLSGGIHVGEGQFYLGNLITLPLDADLTAINCRLSLYAFFFSSSSSSIRKDKRQPESSNYYNNLCLLNSNGPLSCRLLSCLARSFNGASLSLASRGRPPLSRLSRRRNIVLEQREQRTSCRLKK